MNQYGRDPRRLYTESQHDKIAARQGRMCAVCRRDLPDVFHVHHVIPWAEGGPTTIDNGMAVCPECHLSAPVKTSPEWIPRAWQSEALPDLLRPLRQCQFATLNAAPGAGKTQMTGWVFENLRSTGDVTRLVVFVPNRNLKGQWQEDLRCFGLYADIKSATERRNHDGVILTYHALSDADVVQQLMIDAAELPTLFVLDEVHHLAMDRGGAASRWAQRVAELVGKVATPLYPVLNLSGTLFRSKKSQQISTITYREVNGLLETVADYSILAGKLIEDGILRHIKVLAYDSDMQVTAVDPRVAMQIGADTIRAVDLAQTKIRSSVLAGMLRDDRFLRGITAETMKRLAHASSALEGAPVKGLIVADDIDHAEQVYRHLVDEVGPRHARIAHGEMSDAEHQIERFRKDDGQAILVAVQKVTEGFDVPDICVLTYLRTWKAELFINQMVGRAMRVTERENQLGFVLPATVIVPNDDAIKSSFANVLAGSMRLLETPPDPCKNCGQMWCVCLPRVIDKHCNRCGMPRYICVCICSSCGLSRATGCTCQRGVPWDPPPDLVDVTVQTDPELADAYMGQTRLSLHLLAQIRPHLLSHGTQEVSLESVTAGLQEALRQNPFAFQQFLRDQQKGGDDK